jgi:hypothetical protein
LNTTAFTEYKDATKKLFKYLEQSIPQSCNQQSSMHIQHAGDVPAAKAVCLIEIKRDSESTHFEQLGGFDTDRQSFQRTGYLLWQRRDYAEKTNAVTVKFNSPSLEPILNAPLRPADGVSVQGKNELDIYPCRRKYCRSDKFEDALKWNEELTSLKQLRRLFRNLDLVLQDSTNNGTLIRHTVFARRVTRVKATAKFNGEQVKTKFTVYAQYNNLQEAEDGNTEPQKVELSFRVKNQLVANSPMQMLVGLMYGQMTLYNAAIETKC